MYLTPNRSLIVDHLRNLFRGHRVGIAFLYLQYGDQVRQTASGITGALLRQLLSLEKEIDPTIVEEYDKWEMSGEGPSFARLVELLISVSMSFSSVFFIFDALDACERNERYHLLETITKLSNVSNVKIFATSRPNLTDVNQCFTGASKIVIQTKSEDLGAYLIREVDRRMTACSEEEKSEVFRTLMETSLNLYREVVSIR